jgi:peptide deformylase
MFCVKRTSWHVCLEGQPAAEISNASVVRAEQREKRMASLNICTYPDQVLRVKASPVRTFDRNLSKLIEDMAETMYNAPGIGLAANQVGQPIQVLVVDLQKPDYEQGLIVLVNPQIVAAEGEVSYEEGCLSVPEFFATIKRYDRVTVRAIDKHGNPVEIQASGLLAIALQHEMDHLNGKLIIDRIGPISRDIFIRKWKKKQREAKQ